MFYESFLFVCLPLCVVFVLQVIFVCANMNSYICTLHANKRRLSQINCKSNLPQVLQKKKKKQQKYRRQLLLVACRSLTRVILLIFSKTVTLHVTQRKSARQSSKKVSRSVVGFVTRALLQRCLLCRRVWAKKCH